MDLPERAKPNNFLLNPRGNSATNTGRDVMGTQTEPNTTGEEVATESIPEGGTIPDLNQTVPYKPFKIGG